MPRGARGHPAGGSFDPSRLLRLAVAMAIAGSGIGCGGGMPPTSRESLEDGVFLSADGSLITLTDGSAVDADGVRYAITMTAEGDLDFDGEPDAAVVVTESRGESRILRLHALLADSRTATDVSSRLIGDRLEAERLTIDDGMIQVDLLIREPGEPMAVLPSVPHSQGFVLTGTGLLPIVRTAIDPDGGDEAPMHEPPGAEDSPAIYTHEWELAAFEMGDWAADLAVLERPVTVRFMAELADVAGASGQFAGFGGCNQIFGSFRAEESEVLRISGLAATRRSCERPLADFEGRFLAAFGSVGAFELAGDRLQLRFVGGTLAFRAGGRLVPAEPEPLDLEGEASVSGTERRRA